MNNSGFLSDDRGISTTVSYALNLTLSAMLISGLLFAAGSVVGDQRHSAVETELEVIGERIATGIQSADRLNATGAPTINLSVEVPERVAGSGYTISVETTGTPELVLNASNPDITVRIPLAVDGNLAASNVDGGTVTIVKLPSGSLEVQES